jgi:hypothetical protein
MRAWILSFSCLGLVHHSRYIFTFVPMSHPHNQSIHVLNEEIGAIQWLSAMSIKHQTNWMSWAERWANTWQSHVWLYRSSKAPMTDIISLWHRDFIQSGLQNSITISSKYEIPEGEFIRLTFVKCIPVPSGSTCDSVPHAEVSAVLSGCLQRGAHSAVSAAAEVASAEAPWRSPQH